MKAPSLRGGGLDLSKPLDNPIRRRIVGELSAEEQRPRSTGELSKALGEPLSVVVYHLVVLQESGLVRPSGTEQVESAQSFRESVLAGDEVAMTRLALAKAENELSGFD